jgi:putative nucleotidyltransferase with HDIG domain
MTSRKEALKLLNEYVKTESLVNHCKSVAAVMEAYAKRNCLPDEEVDKWFIAGLLHDFDWEKFPTLEEHGLKGSEILRERGFSEDIVRAILSHNNYHKVKRESLMEKTLYAVDELCGLVVALSKVRPGRFEGMTAKSVRKAMKKKDFAAAINRNEIREGIEGLGVDETEHYEIVINALKDMNS